MLICLRLIATWKLNGEQNCTWHASEQCTSVHLTSLNSLFKSTVHSNVWTFPLWKISFHSREEHGERWFCSRASRRRRCFYTRSRHLHSCCMIDVLLISVCYPICGACWTWFRVPARASVSRRRLRTLRRWTRFRRISAINSSLHDSPMNSKIERDETI